MGNNEQNPSERIASHIDELQKNGYYIASVKKNTQPMSARILRHLADLHEAGVIADDAKVNGEWDGIDFPAAIAKNERRLAWMRQHTDTTKTPLELWEDAKRAEEDGGNEHE